MNRFLSDRAIINHIFIWLLYTGYYAILVVFFNGIEMSSNYIIQIILYRFWDIIFFYFNIYWILPVYFKLDRIPMLLGIFLCWVLIYIFYRYALDIYIFGYFDINLNNFTMSESKSVSLSIVNASNFIVFSLGYHFAQKTIKQQKDIAKKGLELAEEREKNAILAKEKAQAEMAFLRSQINPHFMFNTLNMIYSKVRGVSREAGDIIIEFADMMRYATSTKLQEDEVDLKGELDFVQQYLSLHKQRNKGNAYIDYDEEGYFGSHRIVPMVLITLVENAIKHGLIDDPNFPLNIRASLIDDVFVFIVHNLKNPHSEQIMDRGNTGIGIKNIIKRLDTVYKNKGYSLESENGEEDYIVTFTVDFNLIKK